MTDNKWWKSPDEFHEKMIDKWKLVQDVFEADPQVIRKEKYIPKKAQGEHAKRHEQRMKNAFIAPLFQTVSRGFTGRVHEAEKKISRRWEYDGIPGLGSPRERDTLASRIWHNTDGKGMNYLPMLTKVTTHLNNKTLAWGLVDGYEVSSTGALIGQPKIKVINPEDVIITGEDASGRLLYAVVYHTRKERETPQSPPETIHLLTVYTWDGHATYRTIDGDGKSVRYESADNVIREDGGEGDDPLSYGGQGDNRLYYFNSTDKEMEDRILPIFRVSMEIDGFPAYNLCEQNLTYIRHFSELQSKHTDMNIQALQLVAKDQEERDAIRTEILDQGSNVFWINPEASRDHKFFGPDADGFEESREFIKEMRAQFLYSAYREYEDSTRGSQRTATEAAQDAANAEHSYLNLLVSALDEFEMQAWKRIEQLEFPSDTSRWGGFYVERKKDFSPLDIETEMNRLAKLFFGMERVPAGPTARKAAAKKIVAYADIDADTDEIDAEVDARDVASRQEQDMLEELGI